MLGSCWDHSGVMLKSFCDNFGVMLGSCWGHVWVMLGSFLGHVAVILGSGWDHFRRFWFQSSSRSTHPNRKSSLVHLVQCLRPVPLVLVPKRFGFWFLVRFAGFLSDGQHSRPFTTIAGYEPGASLWGRNLLMIRGGFGGWQPHSTGRALANEERDAEGRLGTPMGFKRIQRSPTLRDK